MMGSFEQWKLRGPVRTLRSELAEWDIGQEQWQAPCRSSVMQFRPDGGINEAEYHNPNGSISRYRHVYDETGRLLTTEFRLDDGPISKTIHHYDELGRLVRKTDVKDNGAEHESEIYSYDDGGRKTKLQFVPKLETPSACGMMYGVEGTELTYGAEGVVTTITTLYDDRDRSCEALFHDENRAVILRVILTRDTAGRLVREESRYDQPPFRLAQALEKAPAEERAAAAAVFAQLFSPQKAMWSTAYRYDDRGRRIESLTSMGGATRDRTSTEYDELDNPIREIIEESVSGDFQSDESGNLRLVNEKVLRRDVRYEYKYDSQDNWTERVVSVRYETNPDFQRSNIERREISYYTPM